MRDGSATHPDAAEVGPAPKGATVATAATTTPAAATDEDPRVRYWHEYDSHDLVDGDYLEPDEASRLADVGARVRLVASRGAASTLDAEDNPVFTGGGSGSAANLRAGTTGSDGGRGTFGGAAPHRGGGHMRGATSLHVDFAHVLSGAGAR